MKIITKKISLLIFTLFVCIFSTLLTSLKADTIPNYTFTNVAKPTGYYKRTDGTCHTYPTIGSTWGYCAEAGVDYNSSASYSSCTLGLSCEQAAASYYGAVVNQSAFYQAQSIINGRTFYTNSSCTSVLDTSDASAYAHQYCYTYPSFGTTTVNMKVGQSLTLTDVNSSLGAFRMRYSSSAFTVSTSGNSITITALSRITGASIVFDRGSTTASTGHCSPTSQNWYTINALPYVYTKLYVNITEEEVPVVTPKYGALRIIKTNEEGTNLQGVKFKIGTNLSGVENTDWKYYYTNASGNIEVSNILVGTSIYYQEVDTIDGYILDSTVNYINIASETTYSRTIKNMEEGSGGFKITKVNQFGDKLSGVKFKIGTNLSGVENTDWKYYTTNESGEIIIGGIPIDTTYYYQEVESLDGYTFGEDEQVIKQITIIENDIIESISIRNELIVERTLKIIKRDKNSLNPLSGVVFELHKVSDDSLVTTLTTNETGEAYYTEITDGEYYLVETSAPSGYSYSKERIPVLISEENAYYTVELTNEFNSPKTGLLDVALFGGIGIGIAACAYIFITKRQRFI